MSDQPSERAAIQFLFRHLLPMPSPLRTRSARDRPAADPQKGQVADTLQVAAAAMGLHPYGPAKGLYPFTVAETRAELTGGADDPLVAPFGAAEPPPLVVEVDYEGRGTRRFALRLPAPLADGQNPSLGDRCASFLTIAAQDPAAREVRAVFHGRAARRRKMLPYFDVFRDLFNANRVVHE